jgi:1,4-alpha-glucan branching enzyme
MDKNADKTRSTPIADDYHRLLSGGHDDPFSVLGPHEESDGSTAVTVLLPGATAVVALCDKAGEHALRPVPDAPGIFRGAVDDPAGYRLRATAADGNSWEFDDPYRFGPVLGEIWTST